MGGIGRASSRTATVRLTASTARLLRRDTRYAGSAFCCPFRGAAGCRTNGVGNSAAGTPSTGSGAW